MSVPNFIQLPQIIFELSSSLTNKPTIKHDCIIEYIHLSLKTNMFLCKSRGHSLIDHLQAAACSWYVAAVQLHSYRTCIER